MEDAVPALIRRSGLTRIADQLVGMLRYALNIKTELVGNEVQLPPGTSKIGGIPDLASGLAWPKWNKQWLSLIAQIPPGRYCTLWPCQ